MISKFSLVDIIQSLNNPVHHFRTLGGVKFDVADGDYNYTRRESYIFRVKFNNRKTILKFYKDYSLDKVREDVHTINMTSEMGDSPFSKAQWLKDEFCFTYNNNSEFCDVALYDVEKCESFEQFLLTIYNNENKRICLQKYVSFLNVLKWLANSCYVVEKLAIDSFFIDENLDVKINTFDVNAKSGGTDDEYHEFYCQLAHVLIASLQMIHSYGSPDGLSEILAMLENVNKNVLLAVIDKIQDSDIVISDVDASNEQCFNNPKYIVTNDRDENRITVIDAKTGLKGFVNYEGMLVTSCIYDELLNYVEGYAVAQLGGKAGVIDKNNRTIIDFVWDWIEYENALNLFIVEKDGLRYVLNRKIEQISNKRFKFVGTFVDGYSIVLSEDDKSGVINQNCDYVLEPIYDEIKYCQLKEFEVVLNGQKEKINL